MAPTSCYTLSYFPGVTITLNPVTSMSSACLYNLYNGAHALGVPFARLLWVDLTSGRLIYITAQSSNPFISSLDIPFMNISYSACSVANGSFLFLHFWV